MVKCVELAAGLTGLPVYDLVSWQSSWFFDFYSFDRLDHKLSQLFQTMAAVSARSTPTEAGQAGRMKLMR